MLRTLQTLTLLSFFWGLAPCASAFSRKNGCTVRFHVEVEGTGSAPNPFARPVRLLNPPRQIFVENSAGLSERQVDAVYTFPVADGTWGALFRLDTSGRKILTQISSANRGRCFVVFVGNHKTARQLPEDLLIDGIVVDGMLPIPRGLSYVEALLLQKHFRALSPAAKPFSKEQ
jgi:hypothetical protein